MTDEGKELIKAGADAALRPFANLIEKLFGGSVEEIGGMWTDRLKIRRFERQVKLFERVQEIIADAGLEPRQIKDSISIPLLTAATLEDDETLQQKWAALLANAADPRTTILPSFSSILAELSSDQARFLDALYRGFDGLGPASSDDTWALPPIHIRLEGRGRLFDLYTSTGLSDPHSFKVALDTLRRLHLIEIYHEPVRDYVEALRKPAEEPPREICELTALGYSFVVACRAPKGTAGGPSPAKELQFER